MSQESIPFFVVGSQRSGTTMLRLMLNRHSRLNVPFESGFIPEFYHRLSEFGDLGHRVNTAHLLEEICRNPFVARGNLIPDKDAVLDATPRTYSELIHAIFLELARRRGKARWGDKTPSYVEDIDTLWALFPRCKIIHLIRDGRDVANSLRTLSWGSRDLTKLARHWRWMVMLGRKMGAMIPGHYLEVHYESLVDNPGHTLSQICDFLGEGYETDMLRYYEDAESAMPAISMRWHESSVRAPDPAKAQSWRSTMSNADRIVFEEIAGDALTMFGYELSRLHPTLSSRLRFAQYTLLGHA